MARKKKESLAITDEALTAELARFRNGAQAMLAWAATCSLETQADVDAADAGLLKVHQAQKLFEQRKEEIVGPLTAELNGKINALAPIEDCLYSCKETLKERLLARNAESKAQQIEAIAEENYAISHAQPVTSHALTETDSYTYVIEDANLLDRDLLMPNDKAIKAEIKAKGQLFNRPGIKLVTVTRGTVRV